MPKRPNPFGDGSPLQMKTHIGTREMNTLGVDGDKNMKSVYEKTRQLLFSGARKRTEEIVIDANENSPCIPNQNVTGQMCLDKTGHIVPPSETTQPFCGISVETDDKISTETDDGMDVDSLTVDSHLNKKISDFFTVKNISAQRQTVNPQEPSL